MAFTPGPFSTLKDGFRWIDCHQEEKCVYVFCRQGGGEVLTALFNFSDRPRSYDLPTDRPMQVLLDTEWDIYGGIAPVCHNAGPHLDLPPFSGLLLTPGNRWAIPLIHTTGPIRQKPHRL